MYFIQSLLCFISEEHMAAKEGSFTLLLKEPLAKILGMGKNRV
jgi:hypothetical protein